MMEKNFLVLRESQVLYQHLKAWSVLGLHKFYLYRG